MVRVICFPRVSELPVSLRNCFRRHQYTDDHSYSDWISLNEPRLLILHRQLNQLDLARYAEAVGDVMQLDLKIDRPGDRRSTEDLPEIETGLPTSDLLPPIYFHGSNQARSHPTPFPAATHSSFVRGIVQLTADNPPQVRWTLIIRYGGEDRWRLECVQPGGRGSRRGLFGVSFNPLLTVDCPRIGKMELTWRQIWTDAQREEHSPCGPVWYWPVVKGEEE